MRCVQGPLTLSLVLSGAAPDTEQAQGSCLALFAVCAVLSDLECPGT